MASLSSQPRQGIRRVTARMAHLQVDPWCPPMASWSPLILYRAPVHCRASTQLLPAFLAVCQGSGPGGPWESSCLGLSVHWLHSPARLAPRTPAASLCLSFCTCCMSCLGHLPCHPHQPFREESVLITFLLVVTNYSTKTTAERKSLFCCTVPGYNPSWWGSYRMGAGGCWSHCVQF